MTNQISTTYLKKHLLLNIGGAYHLSLIAIVIERSHVHHDYVNHD